MELEAEIADVVAALNSLYEAHFLEDFFNRFDYSSLRKFFGRI